LKRTSFKDWICFEHEQFIAINKPAGISTLHERSGESLSIIELAGDFDANLRLCHRIDRDTTGLLLMARNEECYKEINSLFEKRLITKKYLAIVWGKPNLDHTTVSLPLAPAKQGRSKVDQRNGKPSETDLKLLKAFKSSALIEASPKTGRLHQIRVHTSSIGFPIMGDTTYGGNLPYMQNFKRNFSPSNKKAAAPMIRRMALHAQSLAFELGGQQFLIEAPVPDDMLVLMKLLDKYDV
jgi:23S rRNA pseudouridine955/2504/2580 synthase